jgi:hypothetical protein
MTAGRIAASLVLLSFPGVVATGSAEEDPRSRVIVVEDCRSDLGRREVTLFANGTIRRRQGAVGAEILALAEVGREEVDAFVRRLTAPDLTETETRELSPEGTWVERCSLELRLPDAPVRTFRYGRYESLSLALRAVVDVVRDIEAVIGPGQREVELPPAYRPEPGDMLERADGVRFEVVGPTADGLGLELSSPDQPLTIFVPAADVRLHFVKLLRRGWGPV